MTDLKDPRCILFGETVRRLRKDLDISQEEFADRVGIHRTYIGGIERGERNPTLTTISKIASALGVAPRELLPPLDENAEYPHDTPL